MLINFIVHPPFFIDIVKFFVLSFIIMLLRFLSLCIHIHFCVFWVFIFIAFFTCISKKIWIGNFYCRLIFHKYIIILLYIICVIRISHLSQIIWFCYFSQLTFSWWFLLFILNSRSQFRFSKYFVFGISSVAVLNK